VGVSGQVVKNVDDEGIGGRYARNVYFPELSSQSR